MAIDFTLSDEQKALQAGARAFGREVLSQVRAAIAPFDKPEERFFATRAFYAQFAQAGFVHSLFPKAYGGAGTSALDFAIAAEELTSVDVNVPTTLLATGLGMEPIVGFATEEQKRRWIGEILEAPAERLAAFAFTEAAGGANFDCPDPAAGVHTFARREGDEWVISGRKHYTTNGSGWDGKGAHLYTVVCRTDPTRPPAESLAVIVVPGSARGVEVAGYLDTAGHRAVSSPRVHFNEVRVPVSNLLGQPGDGEKIVWQAFSWSAALIGSACTGVMRAAFDIALDFAKSQKRSGSVPVIEHQNAGYMLADIKMRLEAARYMTWKACHQLDVTHRRSDELAVMTKVYCSELAVQVVYDAMRLVGIDSYTTMTPLASLMNDALCFPLYDGGNMGVRRRQLQAKLKAPGYDPMAVAEGRA